MKFKPNLVALCDWLVANGVARHARVLGTRFLRGGALQQHHCLDIVIEGGRWHGRQRWVLRHRGETRIPWGITRRCEYAAMRACRAAGVACPVPIVAADDPAVIGRDFLIMTCHEGIGDPIRLIEAAARAGTGEALVRDLGRELARIHACPPPAEFGGAGSDPIEAQLALLRNWTERLGGQALVPTFALRWLERHRPEPWPTAMRHGDFRTGNFLIGRQGLETVLDFEFAGPGDPREDLGWLTMRYWRFGVDDRPVGGLGSLDAFFEAYRHHGGRQPEPDELLYFQVLANLRWWLIATMQWQRYARDGEAALDLALTGHVRPHIEAEILRLIEAARS